MNQAGSLRAETSGAGSSRTAARGDAQAADSPHVAPHLAPPPQADQARERLTRRYAAGEIERDEYLQKRADLST